MKYYLKELEKKQEYLKESLKEAKDKEAEKIKSQIKHNGELIERVEKSIAEHIEKHKDSEK